MCSASATEEDKENARLSGAIEFLSKPYMPAAIDHVLEVVRQLPEPVTAAVTALPQPTSAPLAGPLAPQATVTMEQVAQVAEQAAPHHCRKGGCSRSRRDCQTRVEQLSGVIVEQAGHRNYSKICFKKPRRRL